MEEVKKKKTTKKKTKKKVGKRRRCFEFEEARERAINENLGSMKQYLYWHDLHKPARMPRRPDRAYEKQFKGWNDFLGNNNPYPIVNKKWKTYEEAKAFATSLNLSNREEWHEFAKTDKLPTDIPKRPDVVYHRRGDWYTWTEFLGLKTNIKLKTIKESGYVFYIGKYRGSPNNVYAIGTAPNKDRIEKPEGFELIRTFTFDYDFDWKSFMERYCKQYHAGGPDEYVFFNIEEMISDLTLL